MLLVDLPVIPPIIAAPMARIDHHRAKRRCLRRSSSTEKRQENAKRKKRGGEVCKFQDFVKIYEMSGSFNLIELSDAMIFGDLLDKLLGKFVWECPSSVGDGRSF